MLTNIAHSIGLDKGGADLIADGTIRIKGNVSLKGFTEDGIVFSDGSELPADVVVFAYAFHLVSLLCGADTSSPYHSTGHQNMRESNVEMLGEEVMSKTGPVFGLDEEGELNGSYRPCGHPGASISDIKLNIRVLTAARH